MAKNKEPIYQNNPFLIGLDGLRLTFTNAKSVGIYTIALTGGTVLFGLFAYIATTLAEIASSSRHVQSMPVETPLSTGGTLALALFIVAGLIVYLAVSLLLYGVTEYAAARLAQGNTVQLGEAFKQVITKFPGYFWVYTIVIVKVFLWSLLFVVPGIIMLNRYILAGTIYFAEGKQGNDAVKRSAELTKGSWLTTYGGVWAWNIISQGMATLVFWPGVMAVLYRQLSAATGTTSPKPPAHILSWLIVFVPVALLAMMALLMGAVILVLTIMSIAP